MMLNFVRIHRMKQLMMLMNDHDLMLRDSRHLDFELEIHVFVQYYDHRLWMAVIVLIDFEHHEQMCIIHANCSAELNYREQILEDEIMLIEKTKTKCLFYLRLAYLWVEMEA